MPEGGRVIAGTARGIRLSVPPNGTRPLTDRVKESLFASLESEGVLAQSFLDLFAGSGAAGIEALSRGAYDAVFVERDRRACASIRTNLERTGLARGKVVCSDVFAYLNGDRKDVAFGAVFIDPPYDMPVLHAVLELVGASGNVLLGSGSVVVAKHFWRDEVPEHIGTLTRTRQKRFGETMLSYYTRAG